MWPKYAVTVVLTVWVGVGFAGPDTITYQGSVLDSLGKPVLDGSYRMQFKLFDSAVGGSNRWQETQTVEVNRGLFSTTLGLTAPLHQVFMTYSALWLEVAVDVDGSGLFDPGELYQPRQRMSGSPWACPRLEPNSTSVNLVGGWWGNGVTSGVVGATIAGGGSPDDGSGYVVPNVVTDDFGTVGGGSENVAGDNAGTLDDARYAIVAGGANNQATHSFAAVGGGSGNRAEGAWATVGGGKINHAAEWYSVIGGGISNRANEWYSAVLGGHANTAGGGYSAVAGGEVNAAAGAHAFAGGGHGNRAAGEYSTVAGGDHNAATTLSATVGGGERNVADAPFSTVPGGSYNEATGPYSFAAGRRAKADHRGSFVLADSANADYASVREDALRARFNGGATFQVNGGHWIRIWHNTAPIPARVLEAGNGAYLTAGGAWQNSSDRNSKENFEPVDGRDVLDRLAAVPIQQWNYKADAPSVRHMGPTAQDLHAAFGLGGDDKSIATIDADGVALAAIQGLHKIVQEKDGEIAELRRQNAEVVARLEALEDRLASLAEKQSRKR